MDKDQLIHKYLTQTLSDQERSIFDELLEQDAAFKQEVDLLQDLQKVTEFHDDVRTRALVSEFESEHTLPTKRPKTKIWWVAASIILLLGLSYFLVPQQADTQKLFVENFQPYRNIVQPISRATPDEDLATKAFRSYENGDYQAALNSFENLYSETQSEHYLFYKANALIELNRPHEAIDALQSYLNTDDQLTDRAHWYMAMAYLKLDDVENTRKWLREIVVQNKYNAAKAQLLLEELD